MESLIPYLDHNMDPEVVEARRVAAREKILTYSREGYNPVDGFEQDSIDWAFTGAEHLLDEVAANVQARVDRDAEAQRVSLEAAMLRSKIAAVLKEWDAERVALATVEAKKRLGRTLTTEDKKLLADAGQRGR